MLRLIAERNKRLSQIPIGVDRNDKGYGKLKWKKSHVVRFSKKKEKNCFIHKYAKVTKNNSYSFFFNW